MLEWKLFVFHDATYLHTVEVAIGVHPAPNYADTFLWQKE